MRQEGRRFYNHKINNKNIKKYIVVLILGKKHNMVIRIKSRFDKKKNNIPIFFILYNILKLFLFHLTIKLIIKAQIYLYSHFFLYILCIHCFSFYYLKLFNHFLILFSIIAIIIITNTFKSFSSPLSFNLFCFFFL